MYLIATTVGHRSKQKTQQKVKTQDNGNSMKENEKEGCKSPQGGLKREKNRGGFDLLIGMAVPSL